jgi:hypothetical protein
LLAASSPYSRKGALWDAHKKHFGRDGDPILVWQAPTLRMNPSADAAVIAKAYEDDPANAAAEFGGLFRSDIEALLTREAVEACIATGVHERARVPGITYSAFVDPSGGSADSMTVAICHKEGEIGILDAVRERKPPFSPESTVEDFCVLLKAYGISKVIGDRYAGEWPREQFKKHGVTYDPSAKPKSDLYRDSLPLLNSRKVELLDHAKLTAQLLSLERRTSRGGRDSIDHPPHGHDDIANAVCGAITNLSTKKYAYDGSLEWVGSSSSEEFRQSNLHQYINSAVGRFFR